MDRLKLENFTIRQQLEANDELHKKHLKDLQEVIENTRKLKADEEEDTPDFNSGDSEINDDLQQQIEVPTTDE